MKAIILLSLLLSVTASAGCKATYMEDPCSIEGYGIVETEKFIPGKHNWMHDVHYFGEDEATLKKRKKSRRVRRYTLVKRCRFVKVPR